MSLILMLFLTRFYVFFNVTLITFICNFVKVLAVHRGGEIKEKKEILMKIVTSSISIKMTGGLVLGNSMATLAFGTALTYLIVLIQLDIEHNELID